MAKLPSENIESIAVAKVTEVLSYCELISPKITSNEKGICWDGEILVYNSPNHNKNNLYSSIPVQVKGHNVDFFTKKQVFEKADLINYCMKKSIIFFSVQFLSKEKYKIFYRAMQTIDIRKTLQTFGKNNTKSLTMLPLMENPDALQKMILKFAQQHNEFQTMQNVNSIRDLYSKLGRSVPVQFSVDIPNNSSLGDFINIIKKESPYIFYENQDGIKFVVDRVDFKELLIKTKRITNISVGGEAYFTEVLITSNGKKTKYECNSSLYFEVDNNSITWNYRFSGSFIDRKKVCNFLYQLYKNQSMYINGVEDKFNGGNELFDINKIIQYREFYGHFDRLIDLLKIEKMPDFENAKEGDFQAIENLYKTLVLKEKFRKFVDCDTFTTFEAFGLKILVYIKNLDDYCLIFNWDDSDYIGDVLKDSNGNSIFTDIHFILACDNPNGFTRIDNINYSKLNEVVLSRIDDKQDLSLSVFVLLNLIKVFDQTKEVRFLNHAEDLANLISSHVSESFGLINVMQIKKRKGTLLEEDKSKLHTMLEEATDETIKLGIYILLDDKINSQRIFDSLSDEKRNIFKNYPIFHISSLK